MKGYGDWGLLRKVIENLLDNAFKFTSKVPQAKIEFGITTIRDKKAYFIKDNRVGFDMAYADKLFAPFRRLHSNKDFPVPE